jgi:anaerobic C4-dicarboxylate transporter
MDLSILYNKTAIIEFTKTQESRITNEKNFKTTTTAIIKYKILWFIQLYRF